MGDTADAVFPPPPGAQPRSGLVPIVVGLGIVALFEVFFIGMAISGLLRDDWLRVFVGVGLAVGAVLLAIATGRKLTNQIRTTPLLSDIRSGAGALDLDRSCGLLRAELGAWSVLSATLVVAGAGVLLGWGELPMGHGQDLFLPVSFVALAVAGAASTIAGWATVRGMLQLPPQEIVYRGRWRGWSVPWSSVEAVATLDQPREDSGAHLMLRVVGQDPRLVKADESDVGAYATYWLLDYYLRHPEHRDELADQRAVERLRSGGVITKQGWISRA
ncbi:Uncharacterised protein [Gordonia paraffinivorans]|uniref:Uncharacterized protein n=1 Tax=Gordonia paraffinivorans TaxID=175628 RepID=A0ABD7V5P8_9ACTN|nr:hypothetical protein [Gordonia paraffinivorans]VFA89585.1 Uncharacterised protein [Gordonia paraffinivorans]